MRVVEVAAGAVDDVICRDPGRLVVALADCAWTMGTGLSLGGLAYAGISCILYLRCSCCLRRNPFCVRATSCLTWRSIGTGIIFFSDIKETELYVTQ